MTGSSTGNSICDLCGSETGVWWGWETVNVASSPEEARENGTFWAEDSTWYLCDTCHRMALNDRQKSILDRGFRHAHSLQGEDGAIFLAVDDQGVAHKVDMEDRVRSIHAAFWEHKNGHFERVVG